MKKKGDLYRQSPKSLGQILQGMARDIAVPDARHNLFWNYKPLPAMDEWWRCPKKTKALCGGNKAGKTVSSVVECIMVYTGLIPPALQGVYPHKIPNDRPRHVRIIVQDYTKHWPETIKPLLLGNPLTGDVGMLPETWSNYDPIEHMFYGPDGSYLSIVAVDPREAIDPNVLRGPLIDHTMIDEIQPEIVYSESLARGIALKNGPRTVTLPYCPQEGYECWTYNRLYASTYDKITKQKLPENKRNPDIFCQVISIKDNPSVGEDQIQALISSLRDWEVPFRVYGEYSQRAANPYFRIEPLLKWEKENRTYQGVPVFCKEVEVDIELGIFKGEIVPAENYDPKSEAVWFMWDEPTAKHRYVLSADSADGNPDGDYHSASVWDFTDEDKPVQVAHMMNRIIKPGMFAQQCACMANCFGNCLLIPEVNNTSGGIMIDRLRNYRNLYRRITTGKQDELETEKLGWRTDAGSKGPMLEDFYRKLDKLTQKDYCPFKSRDTLVQMMAYEEKILRDYNNVARVSWGAKHGEHDDCVIDAAMAFRILMHEYHKLSSCNLEKHISKSRIELTKMEKEAQKMSQRSNVSAFSGMKPKPCLNDLWRKAHGENIYGKRNGVH